MALVLKFIFWGCLGAIAFNYAGYPFVLYLLSVLGQAKSDLSFLLRRRSRRAKAECQWPSVAMVISAYNEEAIIAARVRNALDIDYPAGRFQVLVGLDSPTDATPEILASLQSPNLKIFPFFERRGKLAVISDLAQRTSAEILVFSDANTLFEPQCVANLVRHFDDPSVGVVSGEEVRVGGPGIDTGAEGLYWRYESALKILESRTQLLHSANGGVVAIRRALFHAPPDLIVEDFQIPLDLRFRGYRVLYDPEAVAIEEFAPTFDSQLERRIRLSAGNFQTLFGHLEYLNPLKGGFAFAYWSHRVLRWLAPLFLLAALVCNLLLLKDIWYRVFLAIQGAFYGLGVAGYWLKRRGMTSRVCKLPLYFCSMNAAYVLGLFRFCRGRQGMAWAVTPRRSGSAILPTNRKEGALY
jgi:cellulose synthase/poly-beta-1,6-N-acetylglucosamine synthase-like glycosyltransferase